MLLLGRLKQLGSLLLGLDFDNFFFVLVFLFLRFILFIFNCSRSLLLHKGLSLVVASRGYFSLQYEGFSLSLLLLQSTGSGAQELQ